MKRTDIKLICVFEYILNYGGAGQWCSLNIKSIGGHRRESYDRNEYVSYTTYSEYFYEISTESNGSADKILHCNAYERFNPIRLKQQDLMQEKQYERR